MVNENAFLGFTDECKKIVAEISKDIIGHEDIVEDTVTAIIAGGNILLEGVPGVGKTRLVRSLGQTLNLPFSRIQFTPDLMPADVIGTEVIVKDEHGGSHLKFQPGPIFSSIVLADEINRATPKTQSALLEAMQEHTVTVNGESRKLHDPFFVLATQNPIEQDGTYPLPEAQMDRFMFKLLMGMPSVAELTTIVNLTQQTMDETAEPVINAAELLKMREVAKQIPVIDEVMHYTMKLVASTSPDGPAASETAKKYIKYGASPRGAQAIITSAKVKALMNGRYNVSYNDINLLAFPALRHRIKLNFEAITSYKTPDEVINEIINELNSKSKSLKDIFNKSEKESSVQMAQNGGKVFKAKSYKSGGLG